MDIDMQIEFESESGDHYCFHHAVMRTLKGQRFHAVIDAFNSWISHISCIDCEKENNEKFDALHRDSDF